MREAERMRRLRGDPETIYESHSDLKAIHNQEFVNKEEDPDRILLPIDKKTNQINHNLGVIGAPSN